MAKTEDFEFELSADTAKLQAEYEEAERLYATAWATFTDGDEMKSKIQLLEDLAEDRNARLQLLMTALREEAKGVDYAKVSSIKVGKLTATKKRTYFFPPEAFHNRLSESGGGLLEGAFSEGALVQELKVNYLKAKDWLKRNGLWEKFKDLESYEDQTPSVTAPGLIPPLGTPYKPKK